MQMNPFVIVIAILTALSAISSAISSGGLYG